jgi:tetratricopeptide (TPR) repeat protein
MLRMRAILCSLFAVIAAAEARAQDKIYMKGTSAPLEGTVTGISYKEVTYESVAAGAPQTQATKDVREIEFDPNRKPYEYVAGEELFKRNEFAEAREKFDRTLRDSRATDPFKQFARWYIIQCHLEAGENDKAVAAAKSLRRDVPDSYFLKESFALQYAAARYLGSAPLEETLKEFEKATQEKGSDDWKKSLELLRADHSELKRDFKTARSAYERLADDKDPRIALDAKLGILRCLAGLTDWNALSGKAGEYIRSTKPSPRLLLGAYLARGKALLYGEKKHKDALLDFLRCVLDLAGKIGETSLEHQEAIAHAAMACARVAGEQKEKEKKDLYRERALQLKADLTRRYPGSPYVAEIDKEVAAIPK